ncbi:MAG: biotin/lipoyl-containing protein [Armatimonadota bacterium]|nr:biotin/lipoyl-containing protein [Armatimonadota bacterium]MDR7533272.1 biotin/lipoyl-containing protein [Armatimonadota bacterium]MDR7536935.1 biotin/lipoyl-containing protein [Armatimonadota bacterium]
MSTRVVLQVGTQTLTAEVRGDFAAAHERSAGPLSAAGHPALAQGVRAEVVLAGGTTPLRVALQQLGPGRYLATVDGQTLLVHHAAWGTVHHVHAAGADFTFRRVHPHAPDAAALGGGDAPPYVPVASPPAGITAGATPSPAAGATRQARAPMPGVVTRVLVAEGQAVAAGQPLCVLEAMKMETLVEAPAAGRVVRITVAPGTQVDGGAVLVDLEAPA